LITVQVAISTVLLIGAGVLVRSLVKARRLDLGFSTKDVLTVSLDLSTRSYAPGRGIELFDRLRGQLARDPQVDAVSIVGTLPLTVSSQAYAFVKEGAARPAPNDQLPPVFFDSISAGYFRTVGIPLLWDAISRLLTTRALLQWSLSTGHSQTASGQARTRSASGCRVWLRGMRSDH